ncbi:MAG: Arabinose 5-phosphate isomerase KdsD [Anaerolineales bacterium]|nr:Arabinose 5-phosphate isomerase KdsD [Anaerolineales bacterium]
MAPLIVREHMTPNPITVKATTTVARAHHIMQENGVRHLPVLSENALVGIVTVSDVLEAASGSSVKSNRFSIFDPAYMLGSRPVEDLMTPEPVTIGPDDTVLEAADLMFQHDIGSLPVVEPDNVIGIITKTDIFHLVVRMLANRDSDA